jgi:hypothetical protein
MFVGYAGVVFNLHAKLRKVTYREPSAATDDSNSTACRYMAPWGLYTVTIANSEGVEQELEAEAFLNATGRTPNVLDCGLDAVACSFCSYRAQMSYCRVCMP